MKLDWVERFYRYVKEAETEWPTGRERQAIKFRRFMGHRSASDIVNQVKARSSQHRTIYLLNCGGSGSHWLGNMLSEAGPFFYCGEVYVPPRMLKELQNASLEDAVALLDCLHLAHLEVAVGPEDTVINSAHLSGWKLSELDARAKNAILLVRDPLNVLMSRTFRKQAYREEFGIGLDDKAYLEKNARFIHDFWDNAIFSRLIHTIRYEDMVADASTALRDCVNKLGQEVEDINRIIEKNGAESSKTNAFHGVKTQIPEEIIDLAKELLHPLRMALGYAK